MSVKRDKKILKALIVVCVGMMICLGARISAHRDLQRPAEPRSTPTLRVGRPDAPER